MQAFFLPAPISWSSIPAASDILAHKVKVSKRSFSKQDLYTLLGLVGYFALLSWAFYREYTGNSSAKLQLLILSAWAVISIVLLLGAVAWFLREESMRGAFQGANQRWIALPAWLAWGVYLTLLFFPVLLIFLPFLRGLADGVWMRLAIYIPVVLFASFLCPYRPGRGSGWSLIFSALLAGLFVQMGAYFSQVSSYPFSLTWSEGNRFYDYSLVFGQDRYNYSGEIEANYSSPGRYGLWGIWFLFSGLPIWFHRLWNALLWLVPPLLLGFFASNSVKVRPQRMAILVWMALFVMQGPIYAPLLISAILVVVVRKSRFLPLQAAILLLSSWYAGISRWTWSLAPGAWGALIDYNERFPQRMGSWIKRVFPAVLLGVAGMLPGLISMWNTLFAPEQDGIMFSQPLLWYRLFPNSTYGMGILMGVLVATGPLILLLAWFAWTRRWRMGWLGLLGSTALVVGLLAVGLTASVKIGGGSNLHNMDMYLITLVILGMVLLDTSKFSLSDLPAWVRGLVSAVALIPVVYSFTMGSPLKVPPRALTQDALQTIRAEVARAVPQGEVLFLDQRQLLSFGTISGVPLVHDYEKKYMMDQAMAGNAPYFEDFYRDLANKRFALILSEPLNVKLQDRVNAFSEENNAWVKWVSQPLLCYYEPIQEFKRVRVVLLAPRQNPVNCP